MNLGTIIPFTLLFTLLLLGVQRTGRRYVLWGILLLIVVPALGLYEWIVFKRHVADALAALGIALTLNVIFWLVIGRRHPPGRGDEITVEGMEKK